MNYSFYGGRRGAAFVITGRFSSITEMVENFSQGGNYSVVNYDEYVIIDTVNKNDPDNGKIFRRGYSYQNELGGAQYMGQIVGPSGLAPKVEMTTIDSVKNFQEQEGFEYRYSEGEYGPLQNLIPGKDGEVFNDSIKWACCSVRDEHNKDTTAYVGFTFPYTVIEYTASSVSPYYNRSDDTADFINTDLMIREDDTTHPYYEKWHISIPRGLKGDALKNFRIISAADQDNIQNYVGQEEDRAGKTVHTFEQEDNTRKIAVYDYYDYSKNPNGEPVSLYLGDYNMISDVAFDEDGTVRISYTHDDDSVWENKFKWVTDISITQQGVFTINYNYGGEATKYQTTLAWIDKVDFTNDGTVKFSYNDGVTSAVEFSNKIQWITGATLAEDGTLTFSYNNGASDTVFANTLKWINDIQMTADGTLTVIYNNGDPNSEWEKTIKWINDIKINTGTKEGEGNQKLHVTYNTGEEKDIGNPLNYIIKMQVTKDTHHLLVLYSDPEKRKAISAENKVIIDSLEWEDLGAIKDYNGILIGTNFPLTHFTDTSIQGIITQLNQELPTGYTPADIDHYGRVITVGAESENKQFFAFDFENNTWFFLGEVFSMSVVAGQAEDPVVQQKLKELPVGAVWMVIR